MKILYIASWGRSGSTIIGNLLGQVPGFFSGGEMRFLWQQGILEDRLCGCGRRFSECETWQGILRAGSLDGITAETARTLNQLTTNQMRSRHLPLLMSPALEAFARNRVLPAVEPLGKLYRGIAESTGAKVIVDASKFPFYAYAVSQIPGVELHVVHLVRDPRAVAYSWAHRQKLLEDRGPRTRLAEQHPAKSTFYWAAWNMVISRRWGSTNRYHLMRYEDFARRPLIEIERLVAAVEGHHTPITFFDEETAFMKPSHTVTGNPVRFKAGRVAIKPDDNWKIDLPADQRRVVTALAWPWLKKYGYR